MRIVTSPSLAVAVLLVGFIGRPAVSQSMSVKSLSDLGFDTQRLSEIDGLVEDGVASGKMPGCVICFGRREGIAYLNAFGNKQLVPTVQPMTPDTVFDMASVTKPVATGTSILKLVEQGKISLSSKVVDYFPDFGVNGKDKITVRDLLIHQSGLIPDNSIKDYDEGPEVAWQKICALDLVAPVGTAFKYSDVNFIVLAKLVEKVSGQNVNEYSQQAIFKPLGMTETSYLPSDALKARAAPTEQREGRWMQGEVHDPRAYALGGIAGHAGLFSTAADLARYASMMLGRGTLDLPGESPVPVLTAQTFDVMTRGYRVSTGERGLSWDKRTGYSINRGDLLSESAFGHGGFTGNVYWIDPDQNLFFIFLSNRVHPDGKGSVNALAGQILNVVSAASTLGKAPNNAAAGRDVLTGLDVLERDGYRQLSNQRVGLITNHTGRNRTGANAVSMLHATDAVQLVALFSPEHGFEGKLDIAKVGDAQDSETGLKILSLYGETRRPTAEMLENVDTLVFDIQDIGARFYTYVSTMGEAMIAASEFKKKFVVLDRPNPIGGVAVAGPMLDEGSESFVGFHNLPVRHGMTIGELALLIKAERKLELDLEIVPCENWSRDQLYDQTGLTWINPSPNMRSLTEALLYPGVGLLETTNVSVGRGTDIPFELIGAPWIHGPTLAAELASYQLPGVTFVPIEFTPTTSKYENELCQGVNMAITQWNTFEPVPLGFALAHALRKLYPEQWETKSLNRLLGNKECQAAILAGKTVNELVELSNRGLNDFRRRREAVLLYR